MVALNAVGLTPISALSKPRKPSLLPTNHNLPLKSSPDSSSSSLRRSFHGGLVLLSSVLSSSSSIAHSLTYEEALQQSMTTSTSSSDNILDSVIGFATENPLVLAGGAAALALPLLLSQLLSKKPKPFGVETARAAYAKLGEDANAQLVDIRGPAELRQVGGPDVRGLGKKPLSIVYKGEDKTGFLKKLALKVKDPENTTLFILDKFDGNSELVAELVTVNGFKAAFAIKDGAEGPRGWTNSSLPWITPKKAFSLDFSSLTDSLGDGSDVLSTALGIAAAAGLGALAFTEVETILQVLGSAALIQFVSKKLLFAEDRKQTIEQVDVFLNTKVAPKELVDEIKQIGKALLPSAVTSKALPAPKPAEATPETVSSETTATTTEVEKIETPPAAVAAEAAIATTEEPKVEAVAVEVNSVPTPVKEEEPKVETVAVEVNSIPTPVKEEEPKVETVAVEVNSVPTPVKEEIKAESIPRPQSPYPYYPDLKPPASPSPSQP